MLSISVITPSYNQGKYIEKTIRSVLSQNVPGLEYIVIDNLSDDRTLDILKKYDDSLHWLSESDEGQADAVNKGIQRTRGDVIGWLNSDDVYYPGALETALTCFDSHPEVDIVYGKADHIDEQDHWIEEYPTEAWDLDRLKDVCYLCQPAVFFRRSVVERFGFLNVDLHYCLDYEYWLRTALAGAQYTYLPHKLAGSRLYPETKTLGARARFHKEINTMFKDLIGSVPDQWLFNFAHAVLDERGISRNDRIRFPLMVGLLSLYASYKWNNKTSPRMRATTWVWIRGAILNLFRGRR